MAFSMDGIVIDRIQYGIAEDFSGNVLYTLTQLADAEIAITAESKEARDANGTLIKKFYTGKSGTFTANNAILDFNIMAEAAGTPKMVASEESKIVMPGVKTVELGTATVELVGAVEGTISVVGIAGNGTMIKNYALGEGFQYADGTLTLPTDVEGVANFVVKYNREVSTGVKVVNKADEFPRTIKLTLKALAVDVCEPDVLRSVMIVMPSFQVSPETTMNLTTDAQLQYSGDLQVAYCSGEKVLYEVYFTDDAE